MHELSIADSVVQIVSRHAGGRRVERVELSVGHLRQVVPSALDFAFELLVAGTSLEGADLVIHHVPAAGRCRSCGGETTFADFPLQCSHCGSFDLELLAGEELLVEALELAEERGAPASGDDGRTGDAAARGDQAAARGRAESSVLEEQLITSN
ncbi:MAG TPA: hydrogenase maturation nickel metallochaperone HypA [Solirubrobacteraceae bacterium]|jgi:hydrogenase nickel incorporation protein HypA/HybF|nr:hydrogenase maturation nickel metallochaperone HypA [Solirubrobacteraceae bacterium]